MTDGVQTWRVGAVTITSILEAQTDHIPPELFFPSVTAEDVGRWVPTFPGARHVYVEPELAWLRSRDDEDAGQIYVDSVGPVVESGLADLVGPETDLGSGLRLQPTGGHTPNHVSLWVDSGADAVLVTGDVLHHPLQCARPGVAFVSDDDPDQARTTRRKVLQSAADPDILVFGTHFPTLPGGRLRPAGEVWRFEPEAPDP